MKRIGLILCILLYSMKMTANAQVLASTQIIKENNILASETSVSSTEQFSQVGTHFGFKFQPTFTSFHTTGYEKNAKSINTTIGYGLGGSINYYFNNYIGTHLEVNYNYLEQKYTDQYDASRKVGLSLFEVPLLLSLNSDYGKKVNVNVVAGPQLAILSGSKFTGSGYGDGANVNAVVALKTAGIGLAYGGGLDFAMGPKHATHLNLGVRGVAGYTNTLAGIIGLMFKL